MASHTSSHPKRRPASVQALLGKSRSSTLSALVVQAHAKQDLLETLKWVLPPEIQPHCVAVSVYKDQISLLISEPALLTRLYYFQNDLLRELHKIPGFSHFQKIKFRAQSQQSLIDPTPTITQPIPRYFPVSVIESLQHWSQATHNLQLQHALNRIVKRHCQTPQQDALP